MGSTAQASCSCGYEGTFAIGGGESDFMTRCSFPVLCKKCNRIASANLQAKRPTCSLCGGRRVIPYDDGQLVKEVGKESVADWRLPESGRTLQLTDGHYFCPSCGKFGLTFVLDGLFD